MADDIKIKIVVDDSQASGKIKSTQKELAEVATTALKTDSSLQKLGKGSTQATNALTNLGRVVQDAPFGFIGIANNINPLIESFQRLKVESGSTGGAFKLLIQSIGGAGGLGLAVSLGSAALSLFGMAMQRSGTETKKAKDETDKYSESLKSAANEVSREYVTISGIVNQIKSEVLSRQQRQAAINELQRLAPEYFSTLDKEKATIKEITSAYNLYAASVTKAVQAKVIEKQLEEIVAKRIELQRKQVEFRKQEVTEEGKILKSRTIVFDAQSKGESDYQQMLKQRGVLTKKENAELENLLLSEKKLLEELSRIKPIDFKVGETKKDAETINDILAKLARQISLLNEQELQLGTDETKAKISAIESAIQRLVKDFKVNPKDTIIQKLFGDIKDLTPLLDRLSTAPIKISTSFEIKEGLEKARQDAQKEIGVNPLIKPIKIPIDTSNINKLREFYKMLDEMNTQATNNLKSTFQNVFSSIGESIAQSLGEGADFGSTVFGNLFKILGAGLRQLGEAMIAIGTAKIALEKFQFEPGIGTVIAGIAAVALGTILQNSLPKFAAGVTNFGGGMAIVGERGPEIVNLPRGSDVIPNHRLGGITGDNGAVQVYGRIVAEGSTLVTIIDRAVRKNSRNGQM